MSNSLDMEHLRTLVAIAECGGFTKAAAVRHISQPALSQHVRLLERALKCKLFERDGRVMKFTPDGERALVEARKILEVHDSSLASLQVDRRADLVLGCVEHTAEQTLPDMLRALSTSFPDHNLRFEIGRSTQLSESVEKGGVDLAFVLDPSGRGAGHDVGTLPLHWYAAPGWAMPKEGGVVPLVAFEEPCGLRERAFQTLAAAGYRLEVTATSTTLEGVLAGVRAGLGIALLPGAGNRTPELAVREDLPAGGHTHLRLVGRRGVSADVEQTALAAGRAFYAARPMLQLVGYAAESPAV